VKVIGAMRIDGDLAVFTSHLRAQGVGIDGYVLAHGDLSYVVSR
jgi:hypothetical protein